MRRISLSLNLFTILVTVTTVVALTLAAYAHMEASRAAEKTASQLLSEVSDKTAGRVAAVLTPAVLVAELGAAVPTVDQPPGNQGILPIRRFMMSALDRAPEIYSTYVGFADGRFYQMIDLNEPTGRVRATHDAPEGARFIERSITGLDQNRRQNWAFLDATGRRIAFRVDETFSYDPRQRPWYGEALHRKGVIVTDLYVFSSLREPGITMAKALDPGPDGAPRGVFGVDITLGGLSRFLGRQSVSANARIAVFTPEGTVVATPDMERLLEKAQAAGAGMEPLLADETGDPVMGELFRAVTTMGGTVSRFTPPDGTPFLARAALVAVSEGRNLYIGVAAPMSDFTAYLDVMRRNSLLFALAVLILGIPLSYVISRRMSRALALLAEDADRIRGLDLEGRPRVRTFVREIHSLAEAMEAMKGSLRTFGLYVPKTLVRQIIAGRGAITLGGERRELSVLFSDVRDYTSLADTLAPEDLMRLTSTYFEQVTAAVVDHGGVVDKFIGDGSMAFWNAPQDQPDHPLYACLAALEIQDRIARFNRVLVAKGERPMPTRIGLHVGEAVVGNLGSSDRVSYSAVGATVNAAARMERVNKLYGTSLMISGTMAERVSSHLVVRLVDRFCPMALNTPVPLYLLEGPRPGLGLPGVALSEADRAWVARWNAVVEGLAEGPPARAVLEKVTILERERPGDVLARYYATQLAILGERTVPRDKAVPDWVVESETDLS
ncbi:MAG: adenylate/guanylate cyclase domain-containing protein [Rhodospirillum sp.]|nr:adenylate/guanylate cyclase domain-containing protein [Rhodospirillum sp.]MCF8488175.1 adenylate/guanylate cyclase domain-containing protein [Rhodospirillum sp.]MCF8501932.1 adenylate/guanylate cyclase domain-containing protein [Rhodospirillum sp.]